MSSIGSESSGGNASTSQPQSQAPNLNPSARSFTPTESARPPKTLPGFGELSYHQLKAVEAAHMVAQVLPHLGYRVEPERGPDQGDGKIHARYVSPTERATQKSSPGPQSARSAGLSAGLDAPKTPPNRRVKARRVSPTPAAYTFDDDDDFYPGTDPHPTRNASSMKV
ncbi:hypothetical protein LX36DRAFT_699797 [Colletotrichum falcatum]|nr:hypothetical protein LX36DRAFT_699797 [Colletotrichum falcatum]